MLIASGFILRLVGGGLAAEVPVSAWLLLCAFFLSLFLAFSKRRAEFNLPEPHLNRAVLGQYSLLMLDRFSNIAATLAIATYAVFSVVSRPDLMASLITWLRSRCLWYFSLPPVAGDSGGGRTAGAGAVEGSAHAMRHRAMGCSLRLGPSLRTPPCPDMSRTLRLLLPRIELSGIRPARGGDWVAYCVGTGLGSGLLRPAPGTWGSLAGLIYLFAWSKLPSLPCKSLH